MTDIELIISLWGRERKVTVALAVGASIYHLKIDSFYHGQIYRSEGKLEIGYSKGCDLTGDDLHGLFDVLEDSPG